jgi:putative ATP-dependent endonuclease of the OLD family
MPENGEAASKFLRQAVRAYPELYFARFVVLGEGASEEVVLPKLAESIGLQIDRSFVAIVPLGGRHTNHLWRLLKDLCIPFATLLDLDWDAMAVDGDASRPPTNSSSRSAPLLTCSSDSRG